MPDRDPPPRVGVRFDDLDDGDPTVVQLTVVDARDSLPAEPGPLVRLDPGPGRRPATDRTILRLRFVEPERLRQLCLHDLRRGGLFLRTAHPLPLWTAVELELSSAEKRDPVVLPGRVVHVVPAGSPDAGMGIQFTGLTLRQRREIAAYFGFESPPEPSGPLGRVGVVKRKR